MWKTRKSKDILPVLFAETNNSSSIRGSRHAAALVWKGNIVSVGHNKLKSHPAMCQFHRKGQIFLHAEVDCILRAINLGYQDVFPKCELYVVRARAKSGLLGDSEPCEGCKQFISAVKIKEVYWS